MRTLLTILLFSLPIWAQPQPIPADHYTASAATVALTIQQPATNARQISFGNGPGTAGASVYCASASTATFSWTGAAATATAGSEIKLPGTQQPSGVTVWTASNVGGGTTGPVYNVPAGGTMAFDLSWFRLGTQGTTSNLTISTSNSCTITFNYSAGAQ